MVQLAIIPKFNYKPIYNEMGEYLVVLPQKRITVMSMDCTSLHWALQDATLELKETFDQLFGENNYTFTFMANANAEQLAKVNAANEQLNLIEYWKKRNAMRIPYWSNERDKFRYNTAITQFQA